TMSRLSFRVLIGNYLRNKGSEIWSIACPMLNADSKFGEVWFEILFTCSVDKRFHQYQLIDVSLIKR
ncbi:MAG: hypothetical protein ACJAR3_002892, partial [Roseivirga sp.]